MLPLGTVRYGPLRFPDCTTTSWGWLSDRNKQPYSARATVAIHLPIGSECRASVVLVLSSFLLIRGHSGRYLAKTPLVALSRFAEAPLSSWCSSRPSSPHPPKTQDEPDPKPGIAGFRKRGEPDDPSWRRHRSSESQCARSSVIVSCRWSKPRGAMSRNILAWPSIAAACANISGFCPILARSPGR
jgi:hypothetical protein